MKRALFLLPAFFLAAGAAARTEYECHPEVAVPNGAVLFLHSSGPLSYESLSPAELPRDAVDAGPVEATSCQYAISVPLSLSVSAVNVSGAAGNGGFKKALDRLQRERPELRGIHSVIADLHHTSVLGIFTRLCTEIHARGYR